MSLFLRCLALLALSGLPLAPAAVAVEPGQRVEVTLLAAEDAVVPGQPFWVALRQDIAPGWHTYWRNPGDSGEPMRVTWRLPEGFQVSDAHWPLPEAIPVGPLLNHGYSDRALLLFEVTPPAGLAAAEVTLAADADWLVCEEICIPESGAVGLTLPVAPEAGAVGASAAAEAIAAARRALPQPAPWPVRLAVAAETLELRIAAPELRPETVAGLRFFPASWGDVEHAAPQAVTWDADGPALTVRRGDLRDQPLPRLDGLLVVTERLGDATVRHGFTIAAGPAGGPAPAADAGLGIGLWQALLFALVGGLVLNIMPCVFPVLSLKALALAGHAGDGARRAHGLAYFGGVMVSFALLAALLLGLRATGEIFGWGFQFQSPGFVLAMAVLFFVLGLSLSGVFSIGGGIVGVGSGLAGRGGRAGSFFTGVLASVAATPCTAPLMGAAVGYAAAQPPAVSLAVLLALGLGFGLPMLALALSPALGRLLPRPGPWMVTAKQLLAFPLYASAAWLVWVLSLQSGSDGVLAAAVAFVGAGLAAWWLGRPAGGGWRTAGAAAVAAVALGGALLVLPPSAPAGAPVAAAAGDGGAEPFSPARLAALQESGRPVFVNFTAAWCITCKVNEQVALSSPRFHAALAAKDVAYLLGDWTSRDPGIAAMLASFGRAGVPLYLLYPGGGEPRVLPQLLTEAMVLDHLAALPDPVTNREGET